MTTLGSLIDTHGYWVLAVGCLLEGETVLVLAGFAAHRGYLDPRAVFGIAALTGFAGDQAYFWLGRLRGPAVLARWPRLGTHAARLHALIARYHDAVIIGVRFAYGLRVAGPLLLGTSPVPAWRFTVLNALGAMLWAGLVGGAGWLFGQAAQALLGHLRHLEGGLMLGLIAVIVLYRWARRRRR